MAKSLRIEIMMAGDAEIKKQFEGMSQAGKECFNSIAAEAKKVGSFKDFDPSFLEKKYKEFGVTGKEAIKQIDEAVKTAGRFEGMVQGADLLEAALRRAGIAGKALLLIFGPIGAAIAIVATIIGVALVTAVINAAKSISELERTAIKLGTSFENLSKIKAGFESMGIPFEAVTQGLKHLQSEIDKFNMQRVNDAIAEAKANMAAGFGPGAENLKILQQAANSTNEAVSRLAREGLKALGQPVDDRVTPALKSIVQWAGSAEKAIPLIAGELSRLGSEGERVRFMAEFIKMLGAEAGGAVNAIKPIAAAIDAMGDSAERNKAILAALGDELGSRVVQAMKGGKSFSDAFGDAIQGASQKTADAASKIDLGIEKIKAGFAAAFENIPLGKLSEVLDAAGTKVQGFAQALNAISWETFTTGATTAMTTVTPQMQTLQTSVQSVQTTLAQDMWTMFVTGATTAIQQVTSLIQQVVSAVQQIPSAFQMAASGAVSSIGQINQALDQLIEKINKAIQSLNQLQSAGAGAGGGDAGGFARGGIMGGRGTGTSDSNLAWLSRGEYVTPARAVRQPGVLQLLEALRRSGGNLRGVLDRMGHFAMGGMVSAPAFARGGAVGGMSNVTIQFPGVQPITGLRASSAVVDELRRSAALAQVRSGGRKPSRYT